LMSQGAAAGPDWKAQIELMLRNFEFHSAISLRAGRAAPASQRSDRRLAYPSAKEGPLVRPSPAGDRAGMTGAGHAGGDC